jgi:hypothetical protein
MPRALSRFGPVWDLLNGFIWIVLGAGTLVRERLWSREASGGSCGIYKLMILVLLSMFDVE